MTESFIPTADLSDAYPEARVLGPTFRDYGGRPRFQGRAVTLRVRDDNALVRAVLEEPGEGRVLIVDNGGSLSCALVGATLAGIAVRNGWSGVVLNGCVRDTAELSGLDLGLRALAAHPRRCGGRGGGERDVPLSFEGVTVRPGDHVHADEDGVILLPPG